MSLKRLFGRLEQGYGGSLGKSARRAAARARKDSVQFVMSKRDQKELQLFLQQAAPKVQKDILRPALREATKRIALPHAKRNMPKGETGRARRSLTVKVAKNKNGGRMQRHLVGYAVTTREKLFAGDTFYVGFLEFGTKRRKNKKGENRGEGPELKILRNALFENAPRIDRFVRARVKRTVKTMRANQPTTLKGK